jgi:hypothetical protein
MRQRLAAVLLSLLLTACAAEPLARPLARPFARPSTTALARADKLAEQGQYQQAVAAYDLFLAEHADHSLAPRALAHRDAIAGYLKARSELARVRQELIAREAEVAGLRDELARVRQEGERLRADLERLKQIDLRPDKRR